MNNNTFTVLTINCSSYRAPLSIDSAYNTCQTCKEQVAATHHTRQTRRDE